MRDGRNHIRQSLTHYLLLEQVVHRPGTHLMRGRKAICKQTKQNTTYRNTGNSCLVRVVSAIRQSADRSQETDQKSESVGLTRSEGLTALTGYKPVNRMLMLMLIIQCKRLLWLSATVGLTAELVTPPAPSAALRRPNKR